MGTMRLLKPLVVSVSLLFFVALSGFAHGFVMTPRSLINRLSQSSYYLTTKELWFDQTLDHYSPYDHRQFKQRYYEFLDYFQAPDGPIFLKICGESSCNGISNDYLGVLAKKFGAAVVSLEHRYYGKSSPFKSHTTENLKYLSSKQALFDLAVFRQWYQESLNLKRNRTGAENSWFVFGVSYSGALSAWFRLKFPHLTCGSLASSAVVHAVYNYTDYDKQVGESAGPECKAVLQEITELVDRSLETNKKELKKQFGAAELEIDGDFLYFLADAAVVAFQYGHPDALCTPLVEAKKAGVDLVAAYAKYVKEYFVGTFCVSVETYNQKHLKNTAVNEGSSDRLWWFQVCTEVAYFQVAPSNDTVRSSKIDTSIFQMSILSVFSPLLCFGAHPTIQMYCSYCRYHLDLCKNVFGEGIYPEVDVTNIYYGGTNIAGSKIIFTNGSQDPWRHASKQTSSPGMPSYIITCHNCGHGIDMRECPQSVSSIEGNAQSCNIPDAVNKVRQKMIEHINLWLSECKGSGWHSM
ncbi:hypothetical protein Gotri_018740 [Gossypium trilobum]|uniref:Serine carboxypeptidase S28 family protein n=1 Tax=Gossypium trilobum TaxID=34281 RepID=A0A7J9EAL8_9ROSI|nr:hypothetical protein [Gossypium trilobum]